ncbi:peptidase M23 [Mergibacter septicus]|uniref:peptidoglycan DD-metalloendopeptidase family protein n=1 Tax=Mergibacter septicus TaxID=221402 RepID=UPI001C7495DF|nr:peptidoglycan DD-metalloendopeptidase family protein [Mergibacter septicus]QDJ13471.1 peptidase M23 [Mergibacter septicus]
MKKPFLLLPFVTLVIAGCSTGQNPAPIINANSNLAPGTYQPVYNNNNTWEPQVQQTSTENDHFKANTTISPREIHYQQQNFTIPRDPETNKPDYSKIEKGAYKGKTYTVQKGDSIYLISYISGMDVQELANLNHIQPPYSLSIGQVLELKQTNAANNTANPQPQPVVKTEPKPVTTNKTTQTVKTIPPVKPTTINNSAIRWTWPTKGKIVQGFSTADGGNKGIDIAGSRGQAIYATAPGQVVYAGNALRGYGNLIIIKHNDDYLSAYAHNENILVKDQQRVTAGQQIAQMGSSGTNSVKLHFEIRYKGKSVNPINYLPK